MLRPGAEGAEYAYAGGSAASKSLHRPIARRATVENIERFAQKRPTAGGIHQGQRGPQFHGVDIAHGLADWRTIVRKKRLYTGQIARAQCVMTQVRLGLTQAFQPTEFRSMTGPKRCKLRKNIPHPVTALPSVAQFPESNGVIPGLRRYKSVEIVHGSFMCCGQKIEDLLHHASEWDQ